MHCFNEVAVGGAGMPAHQDDNYFKVKHQTAVTTWLSSSHADEFNGAICYIPGLHKNGLLDHGNT
ncbi:phytanoyl-CoA dioxygenase family protein [Reinekea forsetii]|jgi:ectoine hydroxylase-related dioxygenase (phytanoyl-CoA dioxygenase family)|uniref:Phytanoyl-CoA dioxygenase n=1 Tax=Reinekea forsetii TaxID=1336806 RepID=A0A2K8KYJ9_9GAMM|nr:phytanoyl-CoA dioxygenase [Reinekea forsetii]|tara:strand:+ start:1076 stop:1270 length:195 start_codon:yes stop_codon:yes gene_type:complete